MKNVRKFLFIALFALVADNVKAQMHKFYAVSESHNYLDSEMKAWTGWQPSKINTITKDANGNITQNNQVTVEFTDKKFRIIINKVDKSNIANSQFNKLTFELGEATLLPNGSKKKFQFKIINGKREIYKIKDGKKVLAGTYKFVGNLFSLDNTWQEFLAGKDNKGNEQLDFIIHINYGSNKQEAISYTLNKNPLNIDDKNNSHPLATNTQSNTTTNNNARPNLKKDNPVQEHSHQQNNQSAPQASVVQNAQSQQAINKYSAKIIDYVMEIDINHALEQSKEILKQGKELFNSFFTK